MSYNCLLLDLDDTLLSFKESEKEAIRKVLLNHSLPASEEVVNTYREINEALWKEFEQGKIKKVALEKIRFSKLAKALDITIQNPEQLNKEYIATLTESAVLIDGAIEFLEDIEEHATIAIVSNGIEAVQQNRLKISGIASFVDGVFTSEKLLVNKPNKQMFFMAMKALGIETYEKVLVIGDRLSSDIKGGISAGLDTCWVNFDGVENTTTIKPTYEVRDFTQLKAIILGDKNV